MPVRVRIHSSEVSTCSARSSLVTTRSGAKEPVPRITVERIVIDEKGTGGGGKPRSGRGRGREDLVRAGWQPVSVVTARAVAPLPKLMAWTMPLLAPGGSLVALKGAAAEEEVEAAGVDSARVVRCGDGVVDPLTTVVVVTAAE